MAKLEITTRIGCKNMCKYCPQEKLIKEYLSRSKKIEMNFEDFKKYIDKVPIDVTISFSGMSEPWLNKSCTKMVKYAYSKGFSLEIYVTGVGMTSSDIRKLEKIDVKNFVVHLPDDRGDTKIEITESYLNLMKELAKSKIQNQNFITFGNIHPEVKKAIQFTDFPIIDRSKILLSRVGNSSYKKGIGGLKGNICCMPSKNKLDNNVLLPNGDIVLCCMDYGLKHKIGSLLTQNYKDIFRTKEFLKIKKGMNNEKINRGSVGAYIQKLAGGESEGLLGGMEV